MNNEEGGSADGGRPGSGGQIRTIASPKVMSNSPINSIAKQVGINFNPSGTKNMLSYAAKIAGNNAAAAGDERKEGEFNITNIQSNKQVQADKKVRAE